MDDRVKDSMKEEGEAVFYCRKKKVEIVEWVWRLNDGFPYATKRTVAEEVGKSLAFYNGTGKWSFREQGVRGECTRLGWIFWAM